MKSRRSDRRPPRGAGAGADPAEGEIRIIGGQLRGRVLPFVTQGHLRPMKNRVREAVFNLLADDVRGKRVLDLFAGTGVLAFEAISRGAAVAVLFERHFPTARQIERQAEQLGIRPQIEVESTDTLVWFRRLAAGTLAGPDGVPRHPCREWGETPWVVFCCPPYALFVERRADLLELIGQLMSLAPAGSIVVVESDERFDVRQLPDADGWFVRDYPPAVISLWRSSPVTS